MISQTQSSINSLTDSQKKKKAVEDFEEVEIPNKQADLGKGSFGIVKLVKEKGDISSTLYAMKVV